MTYFSIKKTFQVVFLFSFLCFLSGEAYGQQEFFPFLAEVNADSVNVRAGQSTNFERLCQLERGEEVVVLGRNYSWYQIQLPSDTRVYISDKYVHLLSRRLGEVRGQGVNVRAGAGTHYTIIGHLNDGQHVDILEKISGWYRIVPFENVSGWVSDKFLKFKSKDIYAHRRPQLAGWKAVVQTERITSLPPLRVKEEAKKEEPKAVKVLSKRNERAVAPGPKRIESVSAKGLLEPLSDLEKGALQYKLTVNGQPAYYLNGLKYIFDKFEHQLVVIDGSIDADMDKMYSVPVIAVSKIQLLF